MHDQRNQLPEEGDVEREQAFQIAQVCKMFLSHLHCFQSPFLSGTHSYRLRVFFIASFFLLLHCFCTLTALFFSCFIACCLLLASLSALPIGEACASFC